MFIEEPLYHNIEFDCGLTYEFEGSGLYITDSIEYPSLTAIIDHEERFEQKSYSNIQKETAKLIQENSYRVVFTYSYLVLFITKIDEDWYLTLVDRVTTDCSS